MLAVNLPFSDPSQAIERLQKYGSPPYLVERGIALGYRDLKNYSKAMEFVDRAIADAPNNPDLLYLKAQILVKQDKRKEALDFFQKALAKQAQLPNRYVAQITYEQCVAQSKLDNTNKDCDAIRDSIRARKNG